MTLLMILSASLLSCLGQLCQKQAAHYGVRQNKGQLMLWLGLSILLLGCAMLVWLQVLQTVAVGVAYPMLSLNFIFITLAAHCFWREPISLRHWAGISLIVAGVAVMGAWA